jgi:hypothetical protein
MNIHHLYIIPDAETRVVFHILTSPLQPRFLALLWSVLGKLKLTRYVGYMPYSISEVE